MAENLGVIIKNNHSWFREPTEMVCSKTIETLSLFFTGNKNSHIANIDRDAIDEGCINLLYGNMKLHTKKGYWILDTLRGANNNILRELIFDIVTALGAKEVFYFVDKFDYVYENLTFQEIINSIETNNDFKIEEDNKPRLYDSFADLKSKYEKIREQEGICLMPYAKDYSIKIEDKQLYLVREGKKMQIDDYHFGLNGPEITIFRDDKSAIIKSDGQFLSDFVVGSFYWEYGDPPVRRIIINKESNIRISIK